MHPALATLIVAILPGAPNEAGNAENRYPEAVEIWRCDFEEPHDRNYDGWPDNWTRRRGPGFPAFVRVQIATGDAAQGASALRIALDGGAGGLTSPPIEIDPFSSFVLEASVKTAGLNHDEAFVSLLFLDADRKPLETQRSAGVRGTRDWHTLRLGPLAASHSAARFVMVGLHLEPTAAADLKGTAWFDDLWLARLPRMTLETNQPHNLFSATNNIVVTCRTSGVAQSQPVLHFTLHDALGRFIDGLETPAGQDRSRRAPSAVGGSDPANDRTGSTPAAGERIEQIVWRPRIETPGFYRVRAAMQAEDRVVLDRELTLAILPPPAETAGSEFGWSLPRGDKPLPLSALAPLLSQANVRFIKFPLWHDDNDQARALAISRFVERLGAQHIEMIGLLNDPPASVRDKLGDKRELTAADVFTPGPEVWYPALEGVMTRYSLKVRWWQLGLDDDISFVGYPNLPAKIAQIKEHLDRIGQNLNLGVSWRWVDEIPDQTRPPWAFLALSSDPPLTQSELATCLTATSSHPAQRWVAIEPLARGDYSMSVRAADLVNRMVAAKRHGASRIFCTDPFDDERGLMNADGTPGELLAPWTTAAGLLSGTRYLGNMRLPGGSHNHVFARGDKAVMLVYSERSTQEVVYLGDDLRQHDLWGASTVPPTRDGRHVIEAGPLPSFITGVDPAVAECCMSFQFDRAELPSVFGEAHANGFVFKNHFSRGARGRIKLVLPEGWQISPREFDLKLAAGEEAHPRFELRFPFDASSGSREVRVDVELTTDRTYQFSIYRKMQVGLGDMSLEATTRLLSNGDLLVEQRVQNHTDEEMSFRCDLFASNRRRMRTQVIGLSRGDDVQTYRIPEARDLIGQTLWIRAEEIGGKRVLSQRFVATP